MLEQTTVTKWLWDLNQQDSEWSSAVSFSSGFSVDFCSFYSGGTSEGMTSSGSGSDTESDQCVSHLYVWIWISSVFEGVQLNVLCCCCCRLEKPSTRRRWSSLGCWQCPWNGLARVWSHPWNPSWTPRMTASFRNLTRHQTLTNRKGASHDQELVAENRPLSPCKWYYFRSMNSRLCNNYSGL